MIARHLLASATVSICGALLCVSCPWDQPRPTPTPPPSPTATVTPAPTPEPTPSPEPTPTPSPAGRLLGVGYYFTGAPQGTVGSRWGDKLAPVLGRVSVVRIDPWDVDADGATDCNVLASRIGAQARQASAAGKGIVLGVGLDNRSGLWSDACLGPILRAVAPSWNRVRWIEVTDEPSWTRGETILGASGPQQPWRTLGTAVRSATATIKAKISSLGLSPRPLAITYTCEQIMSGDAHTSPTLDLVGLEGYLPPPGPASVAEVKPALYKMLDAQLPRVPAGKGVILVQQAYARNCTWDKVETLAALQDATAAYVRERPRVVGVLMFSWQRQSGTGQPCSDSWKEPLVDAHKRAWRSFVDGGLVL